MSKRSEAKKDCIDGFVHVLMDKPYANLKVN